MRGASDGGPSDGGPVCPPWGLEGQLRAQHFPRTDGASGQRTRLLASGWPRQPQSAFWLSQNLEVGWGHSPVMVGRALGPHRPLCPKVLPQWVAAKVLVVSSCLLPAI